MKKLLLFFLSLLSVSLFAQHAPNLGESTSEVPVDLAPVDYRIYVKPNGKGDGSSWEKGVDLADALYWIEKIDRSEEDRNNYTIWMAEGNYYPRFDLRKAILYKEFQVGNVNQTFFMDYDIAIYGGFNGTESKLEQRNWVKHPTVLSGDYDGTHIVSGHGKTLEIKKGETGIERIVHVRPVNKMVFDGLIIYGGFTNTNVNFDNNFYGNVSLSKGSPSFNVFLNVLEKDTKEIVIAHCKMYGSYSLRSGGAVSMEYSSLTWRVVDTEISQNYSGDNAGGLSFVHGKLFLYNSTIAGNSTAQQGGGIRIEGSNSDIVTIYNSIIYGNYSRYSSSTITDNLDKASSRLSMSTGNSIVGPNRSSNGGISPGKLDLGTDLGGNSNANPIYYGDNDLGMPYYAIVEDKSPGFNTGNVVAYEELIDDIRSKTYDINGKDLAFNKRYGKKKISVGAYEVPCPDILAPTVTNANLEYTYLEKANALVAQGDKLVWYAGDTEGEVDYSTRSEKALTPDTSIVGTQKYFVRTELDSGCDSEFTEVTVIVHPGQIKVTAIAASKFYGEDEPALDYTVEGLPLGVTLEGALSREEGEDIGMYAITDKTLVAPENYEINYKGASFEIKQGKVTVTLDEVYDKYFGEVDPVFAYTITPSEGNYVAGSITGEVKRMQGEDVGLYDYVTDQLVSLKDGKGNALYAISIASSVPFAIHAAEVTLVPDSGQHKIYGEEDPFLSYTVQVGQGVIDFPLDSAVLVRKAGDAAGTYSITMKEGYSYPNTNISVIGGQLFTIQTRPITLKANDATKLYGRPDPVFSSAIQEGKLIGDDKITGLPLRETGENVGSYKINKGNVAISPNYSIEYVAGELTIAKEVINILPDSKDKLYGTKDPELSYQIKSGALFFSDDFDGALIREPGEVVGSYPILPGNLRINDNYEINIEENIQFAISRALLVITPDTLSKAYQEEDPKVYTYEANGFQLNDNESLLSGALIREPGEDVGNYKILAGNLEVKSSNYFMMVAEGFFTIEPADISNVSLNNEEFTYDEEEQKIIVKGELPHEANVKYTYHKDNATGDVVAQPIINVGEYYVTAEITAPNYNRLILSAVMTVSPAAITGLELAGKSYTYNEKPQGLVVTGNKPEDKIDYTNNDKTDVGTYTVTATVHRNSNYIDAKLSNTLVITPATISGVSFISEEVDFDGAPKQLVVSGTKDGDQVTYVYKDSKGQLVAQDEVIAADVYDVEATIIRNDNYLPLVKQAQLTIKLGAIDGIAFNNKTTTYNGQVHTLEVTGNLPSNADIAIVYVNTEGVSVKEPIDAGTYQATATIKADNFETLVLEGQLIIKKATIDNLSMTGRNENYEANPLCLVVEGENLLSTDQVTYVYTDASGTALEGCPVHVGTYAVVATVERNANYEIAVLTGKVIINPAPIEGLRLDDISFEYDGKLHGLVIEDEEDNIITEGVTFIGNEQKDAEEYVVTAIVNRGADYEELTLTGKLTITPKALTIKANDKSKTYGGTDPELTATVTGLLAGESLEGELARESGEDAATYAIEQGSLTASKNYAITFTAGSFTINPARVTVKAENQTKVYGEEDPTFTYTVTGLVNNESPEEVFSGELSRIPVNGGGPTNPDDDDLNSVVLDENVGTYAINQGTLQANGNYSIKYSAGGVLKITPALLQVTANTQTKVYGQVDPELTYSVEGLVRDDLANEVIDGFVTRTVGESVGTYKISQGTLAGGNNYTIQFKENTLEITKKALSVAAHQQTKIYGTEDPALNYTATGFVLNDNESILSGNLVRAEGENVGPYAITQGTLIATANYDLQYKTADLVISKKVLQVTANAKSKKYGGREPKLDYKADGLVGEDTMAGALSRVVGEDVGTYEILQGTLKATDNYVLQYTSALLTITPASLRVTAHSQTKVYGQDDPKFTYAVKGIANNDNETEVLIGSLSRENKSNDVGVYSITQGDLHVNGENYTLNYTSAALNITKAELAIAADAIEVVYGEEIPPLNYRITRGEMMYEDEVAGKLARQPGTVVGKYLISQGTLAVNEKNYAFSFEDAYLTIRRMHLTVAADPQTKVYGAEEPKLTYSIVEGDLIDQNDLSGDLVRVAGESVGSYVINQATLKATRNYDLKYVADSLRITPKTIKVKADSQEKIYGEIDPPLTYQVVDNALVGNDVLVGELHREIGEDVKFYPILKGDLKDERGNYVIDYIGASLEIKQRPIEITADDNGKILGAEEPLLDYTITQGTLVRNDSITGGVSREEGEEVGTYAIGQGTLEISAPANYDLTFVDGKFVISERKLVIKAVDATKVYGQADPDFDYVIISGALLPGDEITGKLSRVAGRNVGEYAINLGSLLVPEGYDIDFKEGTLTISAAPITITADAKTKVYGEIDPALTFNYDQNALFYGEKIDGALYREDNENIGTYKIQGDSLRINDNYTITYVGANLEISPATLTITPSALSKVYNKKDPKVYTYQATGFAFEEGTSLLSGALTRASGEDVGNYIIEIGDLTVGSTNYTLYLTQECFTITPAEMSGLSLNDESFTYNNEPQSLEVKGKQPAKATVTYTYYVGSQGGTVVDQPIINVGTYYVKAVVTAPNYNELTLKAIMQVTPAEMIGLELPGSEAVYTGEVQSLAVINAKEGDTISYENNDQTEVGSYEVRATVHRNENYRDEVLTGSLVIFQAPIEGVLLKNREVVYDGTPKTLLVEGNVTPEDTVTYVYKNAAGVVVDTMVDAGVYEVTATVKRNSNYKELILNAELTITLADADGIAFLDDEFVYTGSSFALKVTAENPELLADAKIEIIYTNAQGEVVEAPTDAGVYTAKASVEIVNYAPKEFEATLTILQAKIEGLKMASREEFYEANPLCLTVTGKDLQSTDVITYVYTDSSGKTLKGCPVNVGDYAVVATVERNANYEIAVLTGKVVINPAPIEGLSLDAISVIYDGEQHSLVVEDRDKNIITEGVSFTNNNQKDVGIYPVKATVNRGANYLELSLEGVLTINQRPLAITAETYTKVYGASDPVLDYVVDGLVEGESLEGELARVEGENVGRYAIEQGNLKASENYKLNFTGGILTITEAQLIVTAVRQHKVYGTDDPEFTFRVGGLTNGDQREDVLRGKLSRVVGEDVKQYAILQGNMEATANYTLRFVPGLFTITPAVVEVMPNTQTKVYGTDDPILTYTYQGLVNGDEATSVFDGVLERAKGELVGQYAITQGSLAAGNNYTIAFEEEGKFIITPRTLTINAKPQTKIYGSKDAYLGYEATGFGLNDDKDILEGTLEREQGEDVGTYAIMQGTLTATENYDIVYNSANYTITKKTVKVKADDKVKTYGMEDPELTYSAKGLVSKLGDTMETVFTGSLIRVEGEDVGTYAIEQGNLELKSANYTLDFTPGALRIASSTLVVQARNYTKVYGGEEPTLSYDLVSGELAEGDKLSGDITREEGDDVGLYVIGQGTLQAPANYVLEFKPASFIITPAHLQIAINGKVKFYGEADPVFDYVIESENLVEGDEIIVELEREKGDDVGNYRISESKVDVGKNYTYALSYESLEILPLPLTVVADTQTKVYGDVDPRLTYSFAVGDLVGEDVLEGTLARELGDNVGTYAIKQGSLKASTNYVLTYIGADLTVTAKDLTVTANAQTKVYGDVDPSLTYEFTVGALVGQDVLVGTLARDSGDAVGAYPITQGSLKASANYVLTYEGADLTITPQALVVTANGQTKVYGQKDPALTYKITQGTLIGEDTLKGTLTRESGDTIGAYPITQGSLKASANYELTYEGADLIITPQDLVVTADAQTKVYDDADPSLTYKITQGALIGKDSLTGALTRKVGDTIGKYPITQGTLKANANYELTYKEAELTITPQRLVVTADAQTKVYGDVDPSLTYSITQGALIGKDSLTGALTRNIGDNVGTYLITQGTLKANPNYVLTYRSAVLSITKKMLEISANAQTKVYGQKDPDLTYSITKGNLVGDDKMVGRLIRAVGQDVGVYVIGRGSLKANANYALEYIAADFTIVKAEQTMKFPAVERVTIEDGKVIQLNANASSGLPVTYANEQMKPMDMASGTVTGELTLHKTGQMEVIATQEGDLNYFGVTARQTLIVESKDTTIEQLIIDGEVYEDIDAIVIIPFNCRVNDEDLVIEVITNEGATVSPSQTIKIPIVNGKPVQTEVKVTVTAQNGRDKTTYTIKLDVSDDTSKVLQMKYNNLIFVNNNPQTNGGFKFKAFKIFEDGKLIAERQVYSVGESVEVTINEDAYYHAELLLEDGTEVVTCPKQFELIRSFTIQVYPNPVQRGEEMTVKFDYPSEGFDQAEYQLYSMKGQLVDGGVLKETLSKIRIKGTLPTGTYFLVLKHQNKKKAINIIVKD